MKLKLMTYNILHGLDYKSLQKGERITNFDNIIDVINKAKPDILSINEIYGKGFLKSSEYFDQVSLIKNACNFKYFTFSKAIDTKNGEYGNAVFSNIPYSNYEIIHIEDPVHKLNSSRYESRVLTKFNFLDFDVISTHVGLNPDEQENAYKALIDNINPNKKTIIMGDFNMTPDNNIIKNIMSKFNESTITSIGKVINTYPSIASKIKIDYIFLSKSIDIVESNVLDYHNSDHLPVYAIISL